MPEFVKHPRDRKLYKVIRHEKMGAGGQTIVFLYLVKPRKGGVTKEWQPEHYLAEARIYLGKAYVGTSANTGIDRWSSPRLDKRFHSIADATEHFDKIRAAIAVAIAKAAFEIGEDDDE